MAVDSGHAPFAWEPTAQTIEGANITQFMRAVGAASLEDLWALTRRDIAGLYERLIPHLGLAWLAPYRQLLDTSRGIPFARWFVGGMYNASYNCIDRHVSQGRAQQPAHHLGVRKWRHTRR